MNLNDVFFNYYFLIGGLFLIYLIYRIFHAFFNNNIYIQTKYSSRGHTWRSIQCNKSIPYNIYVSVCEALSLSQFSLFYIKYYVIDIFFLYFQCTICGKLMLALVGFFCECCAVSACKSCCRVVDKKFRCKAISWPSDKLFCHHWVNGMFGRDLSKTQFFTSFIIMTL